MRYDRLRDGLHFLGFYGLLLFVSVPILGARIYATDVWKALYSGRYLRWFGQFPHHSTFTFSPVKEFLARDGFNWLGNVFFFNVHEFWGLIGIQLIRPILALTVFLLLHSLMDHRINAWTFLILVLFIFGIHQKLTLRTAIFSVPCSVLFSLFLIRSRDKNHLWLYAIPPLLVLWGNLHGSFLLGIVLFCLYGAGQILDHLIGPQNPSPPLRTIVITLALSITGIVFVKPFPMIHVHNAHNLPLIDDPSRGQIKNKKTTSEFSHRRNRSEREFSLPVQITRSVRNIIFSSKPGRSVEFQSPLRRGDLLFVWIGLLAGGLLLAVFVRTRSYRSFAWSLTISGLTIVSLTTIRTIGYFVLIGGPITLFLANYRGGFFWKNHVVLYLHSLLVALLAGTILAFSLTGKVNYLTGFNEQKIGVGPIRKFSNEIPDFVLANHAHEKVFNGYSIGSFLVWRWWPHKKVFQDTKISAYHPRFQFARKTLSPAELFSRYKLRLAVVERINPLTKNFFLSRAGWEALRMDKGSVLFRRVKSYGGKIPTD